MAMYVFEENARYSWNGRTGTLSRFAMIDQVSTETNTSDSIQQWF